MLDKLILYDKELFEFLNGLGNEHWDTFWMMVTQQFNWIPLFALFLFLVFKAYGWKKGLIIMLIVAVLVTFSDQFANLIKHSFGRLRPNNDPSINGMIRILKHPKSFSFVSGHAMTSFAVTTYLFFLLRKHFKFVVLIFIWPMLFAYSRIYLGVHFPMDILGGVFMGILIAILFYQITLFVFKKIRQPA